LVREISEELCIARRVWRFLPKSLPKRVGPSHPLLTAGACYIIRDNNGHAYFESKPGRRTAANLLTRDEARRIAANIADCHPY
jgi:hypothetical protein